MLSQYKLHAGRRSSTCLRETSLFFFSSSKIEKHSANVPSFSLSSQFNCFSIKEFFLRIYLAFKYLLPYYFYWKGETYCKLAFQKETEFTFSNKYKEKYFYFTGESKTWKKHRKKLKFSKNFNKLQFSKEISNSKK